MNGKNRSNPREGRRCARFLSCMVCVLIALQTPVGAQDKAAKDEQGYHIEKPGTITFTVGVKIKGKVEKPQVVIFLPKEKPVYREVTITHSFYKELMEPLPLRPDEK
jgi:hypothetical protein